jgi:ABC-type nitrate/sulfonate/bicarbonate transport system substrate-binding protein
VEHTTDNSVTKRLIIGTILVILFVFGLFVFGKYQQLRLSENSKLGNEAVINVGYLPIYVDLPLFVAVEEGLFSKRGLKVSLKRFETSPDMGAAFVAQQIQAVASIATPTALSLEERDPGKFKIFMIDQPSIEAPLSSLIVPKGSSVKTVADLKGKKIASFPGPTATILMPLALAKDGLVEGSYQLIDVPSSSHLEILDSGSIDALLTYEPTATQAVLKNGASRLGSGYIESRLLNPWASGSWLISSSLLVSSKDRTRAELFRDAIYEATDMLRSNPTAMKRHLANYTQLDAAIVEAAPNIAFAKNDAGGMASLQVYANLLFKEKHLKQERVTRDLILPAGK